MTSAFLSDKPLFADIVDEFLSFIGDAPLVIHNASFDMGFINAELDKIQHPPCRWTGPLIHWRWPARNFPAHKLILMPYAAV